MIHLEIISSSDPLALGLYDFEFDYLFVGRSKKNDLIVNDKELPMRYLQIYIHEDRFGQSLVSKSFNRIPYYFVNGKKVSGSIRLRKDDVLAFGENKIRILDFKKTAKAENISSLFENFQKNHRDLSFALEFIEKQITTTEERQELNQK